MSEHRSEERARSAARRGDERSREEFKAGPWLGVDVGTVRVGVARSDPGGVLATPLVTLTRDVNGDSDVHELARLVHEHEAVGVVVGLPKTLRDREGPAAHMARDYAKRVAAAIAPVPVEVCDERLTTVVAQRRLAQRGVRGRAGRAVVDQAAAVEILQHWLDARPAQDVPGNRPTDDRS